MLSLFYCPDIYNCMHEYGNFIRRADLIRNLMDRRELAEQTKKPSRTIQEANQRRWLQYQELLRAELTAKIAAANSSGGKVTSASSFDADAQLFITNAAITDTTQQNAVNNLVVNLKGYGIWAKMNAIYPFVGGTAAQHKFNLKNPLDSDAAYRLTFGGGWVHSSNGIQGNGTNTFANTFLNYTTLNSGHLSLYSKTNIIETATSYDMGALGSVNTWQLLSLHTQNLRQFLGGFNSDSQPRAAMLDSSGLFVNNRTAAAAVNLWRNGVKLIQSTQAVYLTPNLNIYVGASNVNSVANGFANKTFAFSAIGDGLTDTEAANYYTAVQTFQTTLGRQVGVPIVSDSDAQAFLNAAVIEDLTQANAVNTLVTDLKGYGIWTKMKALYPFVGGTAAQHKFNLKNPLDTDAAFRLVFNGGWTHSTNGALPNGVNGYADTFFNSSINGNLNDGFACTYLRTNSMADTCDIGNYNNGNSAITIYSRTSTVNNVQLARWNDINDTTIVTTLDSRGFRYVNRPSSTIKKIGINSSITSSTASATSLINAKIFISALSFMNSPGQYSGRETAFSSIGDGLTDTEAANYYTAVQTFQTTLSRNV
jgi:hypothetical protein